eukprot:TRINITY_DN9400_c0_g2_i1.p1 TRINITY_DN9400_c0_g2~~TRINITY_DN9400_c0_g2_i1.p1  ORF type:complete len:344 (+),score=92.37 TRINITY_DN9400_c0_g2_i1:661-1692(+)
MSYDAAVLVSASSVSYQMVTDAENLRDEVKDAVNTVRDADDDRIIAVYVFYGVMMGIPLLGFASWVCGVATYSYIMSQVALVVLSISWLLVAVTFALGVFLDDTCVEAGKYVYGQNNTLTDLIECGTTTSSLETYGDTWSALDTAQAEPSTYISVLETNYGFTTNVYTSSAAEVNSAEYARNKNLLFGMYDSYGVVAADCASMTDPSTVVLCYVPTIDSSNYASLCDSSTGTDKASDRCLKQTEILSAAGMTGAAYLISCEHLNGVTLDLNNNICQDMVDGLINVCVGQILIAFFYFFVLAVGCIGMNRFNNENYRDSAASVKPDPGPTQQVVVVTHDHYRHG